MNEEHKQLLPFDPKGLILDQIQPEHWVMGANSKIAGEPLVPDGDWTPHCPKGEIQKNDFFESYNCTGFGLTNRLEILYKRVFGTERNFSDRGVGIVAGTRPPGNSPFTVAEAVRMNGLLDEADLPFTDLTKSVEEFFSPSPLTSFLANKARQFLSFREPLHDWVPTDLASLKYALGFSPLLLTVTAWFRNEQGLYYCPPGMPNQHDTSLVKINPDGTKLVFDSYPDENGSYYKTLTADHPIQLSMRYSFGPGKELKTSIIKRLIELYNQLLQFVNPPPFPLPHEPEASPEKPTPTPQSMNKLYEAASKLIGQDASPKDLVKDGVGCAESVSTILHGILPGISIVTGTWSIWDVLRRRQDFQELKEGDAREPGDIILCVTGTGNGNIPNGHVGILGTGNGIMSNESKTGIWQTNFTTESWHNYFVTKGGFPVHYFRMK